jgi:hypothetical protein
MIIGLGISNVLVSTSKKFNPLSESKISYIILGIIAILAIGHQIYISEFMGNTDELEFGSFTYGLSALASGIVSLFVAKRYKGSEVFGVTYAALGIGFLFLFAGDTVYNYYELVLHEDPYPSIADVFFILYYPFVAYHLIKNIHYFKKDLDLISKLFVPGLILTIVSIFAFISFDEIEGLSFDFYFGLIFVFGSSLVLSLAILGASVFRQSILGVAWLLLAVGIFLFTFADVWYYYLELTEGYTVSHIISTLWVLSNLIIIYALYKHKKII